MILFDECKTIVDLLYYAEDKFNNKIFIKHQEIDNKPDYTYTQFLNNVKYLSASLYDLGIHKGAKVGIISDNMVQWLISDFAILSLGAVDVPRGSDTSADEISYILDHSDSIACITENVEQAEKVLSKIKEIPNLKKIILLTGELSEIKNKDKYDIDFYHFENLITEGKEKYNKNEDALKFLKKSLKEDDLATMVYTSGTTGKPKGVMLLHKNIVCDTKYMMQILPVSEKDRWVSVLPVWHIYERTVEYCIVATCGLMSYAKPTAKHLIPALQSIRPTYMVSVPRIWESVYNGIMIQLNSGSKVKKGLFQFFLKIGKIQNSSWKAFKGYEAYFEKKSFLFYLSRRFLSFLLMIIFFLPDLLGYILVFSKIRKKMGSKLQNPISGAGKLPDYLDDFFSALKINILEGYGMTETSPVICVRTQKTLVSRTVGRPLPNVSVMIGDDNWNPLENQHEKGVIYVKGDIVMQGYYKSPEMTSKVLRNEWLNTGDLGRMSYTGELQIVGRAKETIVLTGGENVEPEPIEGKLLESEYINSVIAVGQDCKYISVLIVPAFEKLEEFASENEIKYENLSDLFNDSKIITLYKNIIKEQISEKNGFRAFEKVKNFALLEKTFDVGDELTQTLKMKRNVIMDRYIDIINKL